jgi:hypothetical protein
MIARIFLLALMLIAPAAWAQTIGGAPPLQQPVQASDQIFIFRGSAPVYSTTVGTLLSGLTTGVYGPVSSSNGYVPTWNGVAGNKLNAGLPVGQTGNSTIVETGVSGLISSSILPIIGGANGGTGVNNGSYTETFGGNLVTGGALTTTGLGPVTLAFPSIPVTFTFPSTSKTLLASDASNVSLPTALNNLGLGSGNTPIFAGVTLGTAPSSLGAILSSEWAGPNWTSYTGNQDMMRIMVNNYPLSDEYLGGTVPLVSGLVVGMVVPSGAIGGATVGDQVLIAYGKTLSSTKGVAATTGFSFMGAAGSQAWGLVGNVINCQDFPCTGGGFGGGGVLYSAELDMNVVPKTGSVAPDLTAIGLHIVNNSLTDVAGGYLEAAINISATQQPWDVGISFSDGASRTAAMNLGRAATGVSQPSQVLAFNAENSGGSNLTDTLFETAFGTLQLNLPTTSSFFQVVGGAIAVAQPANGSTTGALYLSRATDSGPTGNLIEAVNAAQNSTLFNIDVNGVANYSAAVARSGAPTVAAGQIGYGSTVAAASNCGSLASSVGCIIVNIAGSVHYFPYY